MKYKLAVNNLVINSGLTINIGLLLIVDFSGLLYQRLHQDPAKSLFIAACSTVHMQ